MEIKNLNQAGIDFLVNEEGIVLHPYLDSVGVPTIGVGCTYYEDGTRVTMKDSPISKDRAISLFKTVLSNYEKAIWTLTRDDINQNQFNALTSICYNIGVQGFKNSTLLRLVNNNPIDPAIVSAFRMWRKPSSLLPRRNREAKLYFS